MQSGVELVQLAFNSYDDAARKEYVDSGVWMNLMHGSIQVTQNFRPYKATKYIKSDDSFFQVAQIPELCVYPGDVNPRVRWETMTTRPLEAKDFSTIRSNGQADFGVAIKDVKSRLKGPLADKQPVYAMNYRRIGRVGESYVVDDVKGERLVMTDIGMAEEPPSLRLLPLLPPAMFSDQTLIVRFRHDLDSRTLRVKPLSVVTGSGITRLTF